MEFPNRNPGADLAFGVLSDLHMTHRGEGLQKLSQYLDLYSRVTPAIDAHVFVGDIVYQIDLSGGGTCQTVYEEPYVYLKLALERYAKDVPLIYTLGNHEYPQNRHEPEIMDEARAVYEKAGYKQLDHVVLKGYHFISVGIHNWDREFTPEAEKWAMTEIRRALRASGDLPVFVLCHIPPMNTVAHSGDARHSEEFRKFLLSSKRIVNIVGHTHVAPEDPTTIWQRRGGATVIHAPMAAVGNVGIIGASMPYESGLFYSRSLFFEVTGTKVIIHKIDNLCEKETGKPWVVDVSPKGEEYYTDSRKRLAKKPAFAKGAKAHAEWRDGNPYFKFDKAVCPETLGNDDSDVPNYRFEFIRQGEKEPCLSLAWHSDYARSVHRPYFISPVNVKGALEGGLYTVKIYPVSFFGKEGRPISVKLRVPADPGKAPVWPLPQDVYSMV